jgi:putative ABC transport system permease protein
MSKNYLRVALRNLRKHIGYSFVNIIGLAAGLACSFFILLWIQDELSFDSFHAEKDQIYRVMQHATFGGRKGTQAAIPMPLDNILDEQYPEITHSVLMSWEFNMVVALEDQAFRANGRYFGPDLFKVFTFPLIVGDPDIALQNPESIVLSESMTEKYFGADWKTRDDILGTIFRIENRIDMTLTGVFEDIPANSTLKFEFVLPVEEFNRRNEWVNSWTNNGLRLFVRLRKDADPVAVSAKIEGLIRENNTQWETELFLQSITDMYLRSDYEDGVLVGGRIKYVRIFVLVAIFIILIASINFMNLATARSAQRAREIGIRKLVGANRMLLARQFLGESILLSLIAFVVAQIIVFTLLPDFNTLTQKSVSVSLFDPGLWLQFGVIALLTGLLAGFYPALYLSSLKVISVLRSSKGNISHGAGIRKGLVVFQFMMSIILIVGTVTVYKQLGYIQSKDLGVDRENVLYMDFEGGIKTQFNTFKNELLQEPGIVSLSAGSQNPLSIGQNTLNVDFDGKDPEDTTLYNIISTEIGFVETMGIEMDQGRVFSEEFGADSSNYIVNEKAVKAMGLENPVGKQLELWGTEGTIIGVMKDFHMRSLYEPIDPVIFRLDHESAQIMFVRLDAGQTTEGISSLERIFKAFNPEYPFEYRFMDEQFEDTYRSEIVIGTLANLFALMAVLIACLGLFGLASFTAERRTKEIGIRKVLGASISNIAFLMARDFLLLVIGAFTVAAPISYIVMNNWLNEFAFHTHLGIGILVLAGMASILIAGLTVGWQSIRAALANPASSLRSE